MAKRAIIYRGEHPGANVIGYSHSPVFNEDIQSYFPDHGYTQETLGYTHNEETERLTNIIRSIGGHSVYYVQITPPIQDGHLRGFHHLCDNHDVVLNDGRRNPSDLDSHIESLVGTMHQPDKGTD